ncbi:hypothetical protein AMTRI_Chr01g128470 [Amborella trichopoda]
MVRHREHERESQLKLWNSIRLENGPVGQTWLAGAPYGCIVISFMVAVGLVLGLLFFGCPYCGVSWCLSSWSGIIKRKFCTCYIVILLVVVYCLRGTILVENFAIPVKKSIELVLRFVGIGLTTF